MFGRYEYHTEEIDRLQEEKREVGSAHNEELYDLFHE